MISRRRVFRNGNFRPIADEQVVAVLPIADVRIGAYSVGPMRYVIMAAALTSYCLTSATIAAMPLKIGYAHIPFDNSTGFLDGYSLRVPRHGDFFWNGRLVDRVKLTDFLRQWAAMPQDAGRLLVAFEPGTLQSRMSWIRQQIIDSGLCEQRRCAEVGWDVKRPVVY